jgi:PAS domain S-box-containing protein
MIREIANTRIAIVGGGRFCDKLLRHLLGDHFKGRHPEVLGVADIDEDALGITYARTLGIHTCSDYREICRLEGLETIIEVTWDLDLARAIARVKPAEVALIDHQDSRYLWDLLQLETIRQDAVDALTTESITAEMVGDQLHQCFRKAADILMHRNRRFKQIESELYEKEKTLFQIIQGNTIPTFVIDRDHVVTHWNHALEELTGYSAENMVGTRDHWKPFRKRERPIMADVILDQLETGEIDHYYGSKWQASTLVDGGFEAEEFFEHLGEDGRWLFFTAAPIKASDGTIIGAIETLWDNTETRRSEVECRNYTHRIEENERTLSQIIQGSTIPTFVLNRDHVVTHWNRALEKLTGFPAARMIGTRRQWEPFWESERPSMADVIMEPRSEAESRELYGQRWRKSSLIEDAYEAESFFPKLGDGGRWCWFTATPLKTSDGTVVGAIETLWDTTENKRIETESRRQVKELEEHEQTLHQIIQGSTIPTFVINRDHVVTHWNQSAGSRSPGTQRRHEMVGTRNHHWQPFRKQARPIMADVILDQLETGEIEPVLRIEMAVLPNVGRRGRIEAEEFFAHLGENGGSWLYFHRCSDQSHRTAPWSVPSRPSGIRRKKSAPKPSVDEISLRQIEASENGPCVRSYSGQRHPHLRARPGITSITHWNQSIGTVERFFFFQDGGLAQSLGAILEQRTSHDGRRHFGSVQ